MAKITIRVKICDHIYWYYFTEWWSIQCQELPFSNTLVQQCRVKVFSQVEKNQYEKNDGYFCLDQNHENEKSIRSFREQKAIDSFWRINIQRTKVNRLKGHNWFLAVKQVKVSSFNSYLGPNLTIEMSSFTKIHSPNWINSQIYINQT